MRASETVSSSLAARLEISPRATSFDHRNPLVGLGFGGAGGALPVAPEVAFGHVPHPGVGNAENLARLAL